VEAFKLSNQGTFVFGTAIVGTAEAFLLKVGKWSVSNSHSKLIVARGTCRGLR
jgi:hypothetical protein